MIGKERFPEKTSGRKSSKSAAGAMARREGAPM